MTHLLAAIAVALTILLGANDARGQDRTLVEEPEWEWTCKISIEAALASDDALPPECIAPSWFVADVLIEMGYGEPEPSVPVQSGKRCICPVACLVCGGCADGVWDGL